jgi:hypothetical protein
MFHKFKLILRITRELIRISETSMKVYLVIYLLTWIIKLMAAMYLIMMKRMRGGSMLEEQVERVKIHRVEDKEIDHKINPALEIKD